MGEAKPHAALDTWIWVLIYVGMFLFALGIAAGRIDEALGWFMAVPGAAMAVVGVVLIYIRSRIEDPTKESP
ncbi:MAG: hypothetical protein WKG52_14570 [Variovorax sp.]